MTKSLLGRNTQRQEEFVICGHDEQEICRQDEFVIRKQDDQEIMESDYQQKAGIDVLEAYLREVRRLRLLSKDEEITLARAARDGDGKAATTLTQGNLRLVIKTAKQYRNRGLSFEDLIQEGNLGLLKAIERFDPERGFRFSTYAIWWIRQSIVKAIGEKAKLIKLPVHVAKDLWRAKKAAEELRQELGREPGIDELAERSSVPAYRLRQIYSVSQEHLSLDAPAWDEQDDLVEMLKVDASSDEEASRALLKEYLEQLIGCLNPRERDVIRMQYGLDEKAKPLSIEETAKLLGLPVERVKRIEARALLKLRKQAQHKELKEYLAS